MGGMKQMQGDPFGGCPGTTKVTADDTTHEQITWPNQFDHYTGPDAPAEGDRGRYQSMPGEYSDAPGAPRNKTTDPG